MGKRLLLRASPDGKQAIVRFSNEKRAVAAVTVGKFEYSIKFFKEDVSDRIRRLATRKLKRYALLVAGENP